MNSAFWAGKKVFISGHTGFKGSWLCLWLQQAGAQVTGYALPPPSSPSLFDVANVGANMHSIIGDIRNAAALEMAMRDCAPDVVIHMAAQSLVRHSYRDPVETYSTNVMGTVHMLEAVRKTPGIRAVINVTSDKCYRNREWLWGYREQDELGGHDPYSNSKACAELVASAYRDSFFSGDTTKSLPALASVRAGNVIGGGDWAADRLIPDFMRAMTGNVPLVIRNPGAIRPWQHVLEPLGGYLLLAQKLYEGHREFADGWNFGPHDADAKPVSWIAGRLTEYWGAGAAWQLDQGGGHPHEAAYLKLDCSKARQQLGWSPRWSLDEALHKIVAWYQAWQAGRNMHEFSMLQIHDYLAALPSEQTGVM